MRLRPPLSAVFAMGGLLIASPVLAHPGHDHTATFTQGVMHPLSGADHMLAMMMVGLFAVQLGGRALWLLPATFVGAMVVGGFAGTGGISASALEWGIGLSVVLLGAAIAFRLRIPTIAAAVTVAFVALMHGYAHGAEAPGRTSLAYVSGFLASTAVLLAIGIGMGVSAVRLMQASGQAATRVAGGLGAGAGLLLLAAH